MKKVYSEIWEQAKPYYLEGRPMDIDHIDWMMGDATLICNNEGLDDSMLLPLVILHDVGYAKVPKDNPFKLDMREAHMKEGALLTAQILEKLEYPKEKVGKIVYYVSVHDNWAYGEEQNKLYTEDIVLGTFNDLDYMWMSTPKGFEALMKIRDLNQKEMYDYLDNDEKPLKRPFSTETARELYQNYMKDRLTDIQKGQKMN